MGVSPSSGARTVVHPSAKILAEGGPIVIGEGNLIQEKALIVNRSVCLRGRWRGGRFYAICI